MTDILTVDGLAVRYGATEVVHDVGFSVPRGGSLALIGESGSGKSTIAKAVLRLLPSTATATGRVEVEGTEILELAEKRMRPLRGSTLGFVPQDPATALNPVRTIGSQAREAAALTGERDPERQRRLVLDAFAQVGLPDPERTAAAYPQELSGGMLQRALIALAVLPRPALIVADEPTSALDVTIQKHILDLLTSLRTDLGIGLLLITHDLAIAAERADHLVVLKDGRVQEQGVSRTVFTAPASDYTRRLHADVPALNPDRYPRPVAVDAPAPRIEVSSVSKAYGQVQAVDDVSFTVAAGTTHALVGESGSGKTTTVRLLLGLEQPDTGAISVDGRPVHGRTRAQLYDVRRHLQLVYQNPFTSLDPSWRAGDVIAEPLTRYRVGNRGERARLVAEAARAVGLPDAVLARRPTLLSGGQRQRVAIARALVLRPDVLVLDEPTSALDVTVQASIVELLMRLQRENGLTYLFVSHDLALVRQIADTVSVLRHGSVVETGSTGRVFTEPRHPYTRELLASVPRAA